MVLKERKKKTIIEQRGMTRDYKKTLTKQLGLLYIKKKRKETKRLGNWWQNRRRGEGGGPRRGFLNDQNEASGDGGL